MPFFDWGEREKDSYEREMLRKIEVLSLREKQAASMKVQKVVKVRVERERECVIL